MSSHLDKKKEWSVYFLLCPLDSTIRYIGITTQSLDKRLKQHLHDSSKTHKGKWVRTLKRRGQKPVIVCYSKPRSEQEAIQAEVKIGRRLSKILGSKLTNDLTALGNVPPIHRKSYWKGKKNPSHSIFMSSEQNPMKRPKQRKRMSRLNKGENNPMYGLKGKEHPAAKYKPFRVWNLKTSEEYLFNYQYEAIDMLDLLRPNLIEVLKGRRKTVKGYQAKYVDRNTQ